MKSIYHNVSYKTAFINLLQINKLNLRIFADYKILFFFGHFGSDLTVKIST